MIVRASRGRLLTTVLGLVLGAIGIALLWAGGVEFPFPIPPGLLILLAGAALVLVIRRWWAPGIGAFLGLFVFVGFLISPEGRPNLLGEAGTTVAIGQGVQVVGTLTALVAGVLALRSGRRNARSARSVHSARDAGDVRDAGVTGS